MAKDKNKKKMPFNTFRKGIAGAIIGATILAGGVGLAGCGTEGPQGPQGNDGANGSTWYSGTQYLEDQGVLGDFFFDTDDFNIYQKRADGWTLISNIQGAIGPQGPQGEQGEQGETGSSGAAWLTGETAPADNLGRDGDLYLNTETFDLYQKVQGSWGSPICNIQGPQGETGPQGPQGETGTRWFTGTAITGTETSISANIAGAVVGDLYLNIDTSNVYKCTGTNTWMFLTSLSTDPLPTPPDGGEEGGETPTDPTPGEGGEDVEEIPEGATSLTSQFVWTDKETISSQTSGGQYVAGAPCSSLNFKSSNFVDVSAYVGRTIRITVPVYITDAGNQATMALCAYDAQQQYIENIRKFPKAASKAENTAEYFEFEVAEGYAYIRTAWYRDQYETYTFDGGFSCIVLAATEDPTPEDPNPGQGGGTETPDPEEPGTGGSENPETPEPGEPGSGGTETPEDPDSGETEDPGTGGSQKPGVDKPELGNDSMTVIASLTDQFVWTDGKTISSAPSDKGDEIDSKNFKASNFVDVSAYVGKMIKITVPVYTTDAGGQATMALCAYGEDKECLSVLRQFQKATNSVEVFSFFVTDNMHYIRTAYFKDGYENYTYSGEFYCDVYMVSANEIDLTSTITFTDGTGLRVSDGQTQSSTSFKTANYVDVTGYRGRTIRITLPVYTTTNGGECPFGLVGYDATNKKVVVIRQVPKSGASGAGSVEEYEFIVPENVSYIRFSYFMESFDYDYDGEFSCVVLALETAE